MHIPIFFRADLLVVEQSHSYHHSEGEGTLKRMAKWTFMESYQHTSKHQLCAWLFGIIYGCQYSAVIMIAILQAHIKDNIQATRH